MKIGASDWMTECVPYGQGGLAEPLAVAASVRRGGSGRGGSGGRNVFRGLCERDPHGDVKVKLRVLRLLRKGRAAGQRRGGRSGWAHGMPINLGMWRARRGVA